MALVAGTEELIVEVAERMVVAERVVAVEHLQIE